MIHTAIIISMASLGFRCITGPGMVFYFLRKPFENAHPIIKYLAKPLILCSTCMASVHTLVWYPYLIGEYNWNIVITMLMVAFLNTILYKLIESFK